MNIYFKRVISKFIVLYFVYRILSCYLRGILNLDYFGTNKGFIYFLGEWGEGYIYLGEFYVKKNTYFFKGGGGYPKGYPIFHKIDLKI